MVFLEFLDSLDLKVTLDSLAVVGFLEILEILDPLALLVTLVYLQLPSL